MELMRDLRLGVFDVLVGINLLREGLDIPEVSLVAILDADKEGFLRSETSLIQTIGRAARNEHGMVVLYADSITPSMKRAMDETERRRALQDAFNKAHDITPRSVRKKVQDVIEITSRRADEQQEKAAHEGREAAGDRPSDPPDEGGGEDARIRDRRPAARPDQGAGGKIKRGTEEHE